MNIKIAMYNNFLVLLFLANEYSLKLIQTKNDFSIKYNN